VGDLHVNAGRLRDGDRFGTASRPRLASSRTCDEYAAPWRRSTRASARISAPSAWQPGAVKSPDESPQAPAARASAEKALHLASSSAVDGPALHSGRHEPERVVADLKMT